MFQWFSRNLSCFGKSLDHRLDPYNSKQITVKRNHGLFQDNIYSYEYDLSKQLRMSSGLWTLLVCELSSDLHALTELEVIPQHANTVPNLVRTADTRTVFHCSCCSVTELQMTTPCLIIVPNLVKIVDTWTVFHMHWTSSDFSDYFCAKRL